MKYLPGSPHQLPKNPENGLEENGLEENGLEENGLEENGLEENGLEGLTMTLCVSLFSRDSLTLFTSTLTRSTADSDPLVALWVLTTSTLNAGRSRTGEQVRARTYVQGAMKRKRAPSKVLHCGSVWMVQTPRPAAAPTEPGRTLA